MPEDDLKPETSPEPEGEPEPTPETTDQPERKTEPEVEPQDVEARWQAAYTKSRQRDRAEIESQNDRLARIEALLEQAVTGKSPEPAQGSNASPIDAALAQSSVVRGLKKELDEAKAEVMRTSLEARVEAAKGRIPSLAQREGDFTAWLTQRRTMAQGLRSGEVTFDAVFAAFEAENPAAKGRRAGATPATPKAQPPKVEDTTRPAGKVMRIQDAVKARGGNPRSIDDALNVAFDEAARG